jgi:hypothetical protein
MKDNVYRKGFEIYRKNSNSKYDYKQYMKIVTAFLKYMSDVLIEDGVLYLPGKFGQIDIFGFKPKKRYNDDGTPRFGCSYAKTKQLWMKDPEAKKNRTLVYNFNEATGGIPYKINWNTKDYIISSKLVYTFKPCSTLKKRMIDRVIEGKEYLIL